MANDDFESQLRRLVTGLADQEIKAGREFFYDGGVMHADDVANVAVPSILCIAQDLSQRLGIGDFGFRFEMGEPNPVFPLHAIPSGAAPRFFAVAPFVTEVFDGEVMDCRQDLALLFEAAARLLRPDYSLGTHTNYTATSVAVRADDTPSPSLGR